MTLSAGHTLGLYEIVDALGAGGMGEVYRARDTKLGRSVAIKVLPDAFAADLERIARFEREAKVLASLNHPHIAALYGMDHDSGRHFLVMELVEGETLADRLERGAIPLEESLRIADQIADALEAAHERGIVHRDLKPANVKITPEDKVKVLDFGLAKSMADEMSGGSALPGSANATRSPTLSMMATQAGMILGTAAYMSPEQAKGLAADHRSDLFSFGTVLYEMLIGRQPFHGETAPEVMASVLVREPDLSALAANLNPRLTELLKRCLEKNPKRRWQAVGDLRAEMETIRSAPRLVPGSGGVGQAPAKPLSKRAVPVAAAAIAASAITAGAMWWTRAPAVSPVVARFAIPIAEGRALTGLTRNEVAISPDGTLVAYVAANRLYVRALSEIAARPIVEGTDAGPIGMPVFSPDSRFLAFYDTAGATIKRVGVSGGTPITITQLDGPPLGMSWGLDGIIFVSAGPSNRVMRVAENDGKPDALVTMKAGEFAYGPQWLPDREHILLTIAAGTTPDQWDKARIVVESTKSHERKTVFEGGGEARVLPTGHMVYAVGGILFAIPFDARKLQVIGGPTPVVEGVRRSNNGVSAAAFYSVSNTGALLYAPGPVSPTSAGLDVALIDRNGVTAPLKLPPAAYEYPRVSPDGKQLAIGTDDGRDANIWIYDLSGAASVRRLTTGGRNRFPVWADSRRLAFQSDREGDAGIFWQLADGTGTPERLTKPDKDVAHTPESWSPDGKHLLFTVTKDSTNRLWVLSLDDNRRAAPFGEVQSAAILPAASFSPDGKWVAYTAVSVPQVAAPSIFVRSFPLSGPPYLVSSVGIHPLWSPDGRELLFRQRGQTMAVTITTQPTFAFAAPTRVNAGPYRQRGPAVERENDMTRDGRFVGVVDGGAPAGLPASQLQIVLNWFTELEQRVSVK